jgi:transposase
LDTIISMAKPRFKPYQQHQRFLFPPNLEDMVSANHPVRVVSEVIDRIDIDIIIKKYKGVGSSSYHPRMLLKVLVYGYLNNIYSSRRIEASVKENIYFMWLSGMSQPDHHTINRFRSERLRNILKEVFAQIVLLLVDSGHVSLKEIYTDGSKIESVANRYSFVWGKAINTSRERIKQQLKELWAYTQKIAAAEKDDDTPPDFDKIDSENVKATIEKIDAALKDKEVSKEVKQKLNYAKKKWPDKLEQYARQEQILGGRNSYSKTDPGATFMRMKEDYMRNGQLKPGYNVQLSTNNQFVVNYSLHPNPTDTKTLIPHLEQYKALYKSLPEVQVADAGYGSEENYQYLHEQGIGAYVKHSQFDRQQKKKRKPENPYANDQLAYDATKDVYYCPVGKAMKPVRQYQQQVTTNLKKTYTVYQASGCKKCPLRNLCHKQKGNRSYHANHQGKELRNAASLRLQTEKGIYYRKKRPVDVEPVFGNIKYNKNFKRFLLKGIDKTEIEWGLVCIAHNLKKIAA